MTVKMTKTFKMPQNKIDYVNNPESGFGDYKWEVVPLKQLVDDNELEKENELNYHTGIWGNDISKYSYDPYKDRSNYDVIYGTRKSLDNKIQLGNGKHRTYALYKSGYDSIELPVLTEHRLRPFDYETSEASGDDIFDTTKTGMSFYDDLIPGNKNYQSMIDKKNLEGKIEYLSPKEYFEECATKIFRNSSFEQMMHKAKYEHGEDYIEDLKDVITKQHRKFPLTFLNYAEKGQEGIHRMYSAALLFGWDHKFPVLTIRWADEDLHNREVEYRRTHDIEERIRDAVNDSLSFINYDSVEDFKNQLQYEIDRKFYTGPSWNEGHKRFSIDFNGAKFNVGIDGVQVQFNTSDIKLSDNDIFDLDNIDDDDLPDDFDIDDLLNIDDLD